MAANSKGRAIAEIFGKRVLNQISAARSKDSAFSASSLRRFLLYLLPGHRDEGTKIYTRFQRTNSYRRVAHYSSSYDKNLDDQVHPTVVPDHVIESKSDKYWGPHPQTGVFGPADKSGSGNFASSLHSTPASADGSSSSVLDQTAWFRPLEDVEKPPPIA